MAFEAVTAVDRCTDEITLAWYMANYTSYITISYLQPASTEPGLCTACASAKLNCQKILIVMVCNLVIVNPSVTFLTFTEDI